MKIGVLCYPTYGGSGVVATELGKAMAQRGHEVHFINYQLPVRLQGNGYSPGIYFHEVVVPDYPLFAHSPWTLALAGRLVHVAQEYGLDVIHAHYAVPHALAAVLARDIVGKIGVVTTLHGTDITLVGKEPDLLEVTRHGIQRSDVATAVSHFLAQETRNQLGVEKDIQTVYNFVDLEQYQRCPNKLSLGQDEAVLIHISNFRPVKRLEDVIRVFAGVRRQRRAVLLLVGDGPQRCAAQTLARELGVQEDVKFMGQEQSIVPLLSAADLLLLPSAKESFGLVALEAMACGVPVVGSAAGGLPEVVGEAGGILCPVGDVEAMTKAALSILADLAPWRRGSRRQAQLFSHTRWVDEYEQIYRQVSL